MALASFEFQCTFDRQLLTESPCFTEDCKVSIDFYEEKHSFAFVFNQGIQKYEDVASVNPGMMERYYLLLRSHGNLIQLRPFLGLGELEEFANRFDDLTRDDLFFFLDFLCEEDLKDVKEVLFSDRVGRLTINSPEIESKAFRNKHSYLSCSYQDYDLYGDWIFTWRGRREYCYEGPPTAFRTRRTWLSFSGFFWYLLKNPSVHTLPYLLGFLLLLSGFAYLAYYLFSKKGLGSILKPNWFNVVVTVILAGLVVPFLIYLHIYEPAFFVVFGVYFLSSLISYIYKRRKS